MQLRPLAASLILAVCIVPSPARADDAMRACISASEEGQRLRDDRKMLEARAALLRCTDARCPGMIRKDCTGWLAEVNERLPLVVLAAHNRAGQDLAQVRVSMDGTLLAERLDGRALEVDPGTHTFRFEMGGAEAVEQTAIIGEGERHRVIRVEMGTAVVPPPPPPPPREPPPPDQPHPGRHVPVGVYVAGGIGVAALASFAAFGISGQSERSDLQSTCAPTGTCTDDAVSRARTKLIVADVSLGVGVVAVGLAAYWLIDALSSHPKPVAIFRGFHTMF
jgi:hypothetical protein